MLLFFEKKDDADEMKYKIYLTAGTPQYTKIALGKTVIYQFINTQLTELRNLKFQDSDGSQSNPGENWILSRHRRHLCVQTASSQFKVSLQINERMISGAKI